MDKRQAETLTEKQKPTPKPKSSIPSLIKDFCDYTSIHGLGRTAGARYLVQRIVWLLLFLCGLGMAGYQLRELYLKYQSRPISTTIKLSNKATLRFPEVTICNINPLHATLFKQLYPVLYQKIAALKDKDDTEEPYLRPSQPEIVNNTNSTSSPENQDTEEEYDEPTRRAKRNVDDKEDDPPNAANDDANDDDNGDDNGDGDKDDDRDDDKDDGGDDDSDDDDSDDDDDDDDDDDFPVNPAELLPTYRTEQMKYEFLSEIDEDVGYKIGHQFHSSILGCSYRGMDCKKKMFDYWETFWHYRYGLCFTFNGKVKSKKTLKSTKAGPSHGLTLTLFVDQANYMSQFTKAAGYKIVINEQGLMTFPYEEGINVPPGNSATIGMRKVIIKRADPFKNNSCFDNAKQSNKGNLYFENYGSKYSNTACRESCLAYNQRKYCNCTEYRFPFTEKTPGCQIFNITHAKCLRKVTAMFKNNKLNCSKECTPTCYEEYFKLSTSYAAWPSKKYEEEIYKDKVQDDISNKIPFSDNYLKVRIFFEQLNYEVIEEKVSYGLIDFVSDVGGQLGLWLGVSVLAAAEVIELIFLIFFYLCRKKEKKSENEEEEKEALTLKPNEDLELPTISNV